MTINSAARPTARSRSGLNVVLLGGSALVILTSGAVSAAGLPTQLTTDLSKVGSGSINTHVLNAGAVTAGTATYATTGAAGLTANVALTAPRTLIDWTSFDVTSGNTVNFKFAGSAADVVLNRVKGGAITVETGGAVNGVFNGTTGGNIWFLADGGVFIHGTVTASGVLATRNTAVADLNLLSDNITTLKTKLSAASSLIDLSGVVVASGAAIDLNGNIVLSGAISTGAAGAVALISTGSISQTAGVITASSLTGSSFGGASLIGANAFDRLTGFVNLAGGSVAINDASALTVTGAAANFACGGDLTLTTTGALTLAAPVRAPVGTVFMNAGGVITQSFGYIQAVTLTGSSVGGASFNNTANAIGTFGAFKDTANGNVTVSDGQGLKVAGLVNIGAGTLTLTSTGAIAADTATITAATLTGSSVGGASFNNTANAIGTFGAFKDTANGNVTVADGQGFSEGQGLTVTGLVDIGTGTLTLTSTGTIAADTATITAGTLTGSSVGGASFNNTANAIGAFGPYSDTGGAIALADGATTLSLTGTIDNSGQALTITGGSTVTEAAGGVLKASNLSVRSTGGMVLAGANRVDTVTSLINTGVGGISFNDNQAVTIDGGSLSQGNGALTLSTTAGNLTVTGALNAGLTHVLTLKSVGTIAADTATITAATLTGSSVGGASFNNTANAIGTFGLFSNTGGGDIVLRDHQALTVAGLTNESGNVSLTTQSAGSNLTLDGNVTVGRGLTLASAGTVSQTSGAIVASTLTGSSTGGASLTGSNQITTLTGFVNRDVGAIRLVNDKGIAVTGAIDNTGGAPDGAGRDIGVTLTDGSLTGNGTFTAGRDVAIAAANGSLSFATATAGDDLVLRATAGVTVSGDLTTTGLVSGADGADTTALGDVLAARVPVKVFGQAYQNLTDGSHIDVKTSGGDVTLGASAAATGDVRLQALTGSVHTADVSANRSIIIDTAVGYDAGSAESNILGAGGDVAVQTGSGPLVVGAVTAPGDIVLRSAGGSVSLASASAGDDLLIRAASDVSVAGALTSGTGSKVHGLADVFLANSPDQSMVLFGRVYGDLTTGSAIDLIAGAGSISLGDAAHAQGGDVRLQASVGSIGYTSLKAVGDVALDADGAINGGSVLAGGDSAIRGGYLSIGSVTAADDVVLRASGNLIVTGNIASGAGLDRLGAGDNLSAISPLTIFESLEPTLSGGVTDIGGAGAVKLTGAITAGFGPTGVQTQSLSDIRIVSTSADGLSSPALQILSPLTASGDVALDAPNGGIAASGAIIAGRDVAARAGVGALGLISVSAGDDIVIGANTTITVTGALTGGTVGEAVGLGDTLANAGPMTVFISKVVQTYATDSNGSQIDVVSGGDITVGGLASSTSDVRLQSNSGSIHVADVMAGRDILLDAQTTVKAGGLTATQDVAVSAAAGDLTLASASAGKDIVMRSGGATAVAGVLTAGTVGEGYGAGDYLMLAAPMNAVGHRFAGVADGFAIDIVSQGGVTLGGAAKAPNGDVRLQSLGGAVHTAGIVAGRDIVIDAADSVTVGHTATDTLGAGADIAILAGTGGIALTSAVAGGDVVLRAANGVIAVAGFLDSGTKSLGGYTGAGTYLTTSSPLHLFGVNETALGEGSTDIGAQTLSVGGAIMANGTGSDLRIAATGAGPSGVIALSVVGPVNAGRDVALEAVAGSITLGGSTIAGRDVAARSLIGNIAMTSIMAGNDVVLSTPLGGVRLNGSITASGSPTSLGPGPGKTLFDTVSAPLDGLFTLASGSIFIGAETYANAGYAGSPSASLTAGTAIGLALADTTGLSLADANPNAGSWVKALALVAPTVTLFASRGPINIGDAKLDSKVATINLYDKAGTVTISGAFTPAANDTVALTIGAPDPATLTGSTATNTAAAKDWTPSMIAVVNDATTTNQRGSIGMTSVNSTGFYSTTPAIFQKATLNATTNILLGTKAFVDTNASVTDIAGLEKINPVLPVPVVSGNTSKAVMLAAGDLSLSAGRMIVQQNTTGLRTTEGTGYYVTRTLTLGSYGTNPPAIDLFGVFTKLGTTIPITGTSTAISNQIFLKGTLASSEFRPFYRVNGCVIGGLVNCTPTSDGSTSIPLDEVSRRSLSGRGSSLSRGSLLSRDEVDVEDPTITGASNEEIWRRPDDRQ